jgi:tRNA-dihydrouridine synthase A
MPETVAECIEAMQARVSIPVTVKCRIGIDDMDDYEGLSHFVRVVEQGGCKDFTVHARKAWLQGLSPKENRDVPPLNYQRVYDLKEEFAHLNIGINGGITTLEDTQEHLTKVDGVMMGREVYSNPFILSKVDALIYNDCANGSGINVTREQVVHRMTAYIAEQVEQGARVWHIARHVLGLFQAQTGGRIWRRHLSQNGTKRDVSTNLLLDAYEQVLEAQEKAATFLEQNPSLITK